MPGEYSRAEVVWLLSIDDPDDVRALDEGLVDSLAPLTAGSGASSADGAGVPVIARWHDVRRARERVCAAKLDREIVERRVAGEGEREVAAEVGVSQPTVHRRFRATIDEILEELGGEAEAAAVSLPSVCLSCGGQPVARQPAKRRRVNGRMTVVRPERTSSLCATCVAKAA